ncbi:hypothetical protein HNR33_002468 [Brassicibacter mesophilus]
MYDKMNSVVNYIEYSILDEYCTTRKIDLNE